MLTSCAVLLPVVPFLLTEGIPSAIIATEATKGRRITMIEGAASPVVDLLIRHQIIENQQAPIYQYGFEILIFSAITCMIAVGLGIAFKCLSASLLYFGMFVVLRSICGGYHANTYWQGKMVFFFVTTIIWALFRFLPIVKFNEQHYYLLIDATLLVVALSMFVTDPRRVEKI